MSIHKIMYPLLGTIVTGTAATAIAVPLITINKAKNSLSNFVSRGGGANALPQNKAINYVALGDSETAGYVGVLKQETRSYADFLAKSLKNSNKLGEYHNLAVSGERLADINKDLFESADKVRVLKNADLITMTLGANDILAYLKVLNIPFTKAFDLISALGNKDKAKEIKGYIDTLMTIKDGVIKLNDKPEEESKIKTYNKAQEYLDNLRPYPKGATKEIALSAAKERTEIFGQNPSLGVSKKDSQEFFTKTIEDLKNLINGDKSSLFNIDKDWYPKIFDLIKRQYSILIRDLHKAAPHAQIRVIGHLFPFHQFDEAVYKTPKANLGGDSLMDGFNKMLNAIKEGSKINIEGSNKFVKFENANDFSEITIKKVKPKDNNLSKDDNNKEIANSIKENAMPNITDIHPSIKGYEEIGLHLFKEIGKEIGLSKSYITQKAQVSYQHNDKDDNHKSWLRKDEDSNSISQIFKSTESLNSFVNIGDNIKGIQMIKQLVEKVFEFMENSKSQNLFLQEIFSMPSIKGLPEFYKDSIKRIVIKVIWSLIDSFRVTEKTLKNGLNDENITNENQWKVSQLGLINFLMNLFSLQAIAQQVSSLIPSH